MDKPFSAAGADNILIDKSREEQRIILAVALVPGEPDHDSEIVEESEIEKAMISWMASGHHIKLNHETSADDKVTVIQCFLAPQNYSINGIPIKKGSLVLGLKLSEDLFEAVKLGEYSGLSIAGRCKVREE